MNKGISYITKAGLYTALIGALVGPSSVLGDDFLFNFNNTFSGTSPANPAPWVTAEIKDVAANTVDLTFSGSGLQGTEYVDELYLNFNPTLDPTELSITELSSVGAFVAPTNMTGANQFKADGDGYYDVEFGFSTDNGSRFIAGDSVTLQITGTNVNADDFDFSSQMGGGAGTWLAAAHINSIGNGQSGWDSPTELTPVPEPTPAVIIAVGSGFWIAVRRFRNRG